MNQSLQIGELAKRTACLVETIRYYEQEGLLPNPRPVQRKLPAIFRHSRRTPSIHPALPFVGHDAEGDSGPAQIP
jgi:MerR family regulatory protein